MSQLIRPIRMFFLLFQVAAPIPLRSILPGAVLLSAWLLLSSRISGLTAELAFTLAVTAALSCQVAVHLPRIITRVARVSTAGTAATLVLIATILPLALLFGAKDVLWCQRLLTVVPVCIAAIHLVALSDRSIAEFLWPDPRLAEMRGALTRVMLLKNLVLAFLNEAVILSHPPELWLIFAAVLPFGWHYATSALTTIVFLDNQNQR